MSELRYLIAGCGSAGRVHAYHFTNSPGVKACAAIDPSVENRRFFKDHFGFESDGSDLLEALEQTDPDLVSLASPPGVHLEQIRTCVEWAASRSKSLDIFCEKPLMRTPEECNELEEMHRGFRGRLGIMLPRRFYNNTLALKAALDKGALGEIQSVNFDLKCWKSPEYYATWRGTVAMAGGGVLMSQAIHSIDQLVFLLGAPVSVEGQCRITRDYIEIEDEGDAVVTFAGGVTANIKARANDKDVEWTGITTIIGSAGRVTLDSAQTLEWDVDAEAPLAEEQEDVPEIYKPGYYGPGHLKVITDYMRAVRNGEDPHVSGFDSLTAQKLIFGIYRSSKTGSVINL